MLPKNKNPVIWSYTGFHDDTKARIYKFEPHY